MPNNILESEKRLSDSILWKLQKEVYCQFGIDAWNLHGVPSYITSNSYTAKCYAHICLGYLRDAISDASIHLDQPLYLFDLGAGTGRFAYFFLKELLQLLSLTSLPKIQLRYIMTDIVPSNIEFWQNHPYLKSYQDQGLLDFAFFQHDQKNPLHLINQNHTLSKENLINPLILICNYFFDTIPQDLFRVKNGQLEEGRITLFTHEEKLTLSDPELINHLHDHYSFFPIEDPETYYNTSGFTHLLKSYAQVCESSPFLFPIGAFQVLNTFKNWSENRFCLIAGDQGVCTIDQIQNMGEPKLSLHGSFSFSVSYYILAAFFSQNGGKAWLTSFSDPAFVTMVGLLGSQKEVETALAFHQHFDNFEPTDYFKCVSLLEKGKELSLELLLLLIKLGNWDANVFLTFFSAIRKHLPTANQRERQVLSLTIDKVWEYFYPIDPSTGAFVLNLGVLLFEMGDFAKAIVYFERAINITGENQLVLMNLSACYQKLGWIKQAKEYQLKASKLSL